MRRLVPVRQVHQKQAVTLGLWRMQTSTWAACPRLASSSPTRWCACCPDFQDLAAGITTTFSLPNLLPHGAFVTPTSDGFLLSLPTRAPHLGCAYIAVQALQHPGMHEMVGLHAAYKHCAPSHHGVQEAGLNTRDSCPRRAADGWMHACRRRSWARPAAGPGPSPSAAAWRWSSCTRASPLQAPPRPPPPASAAPSTRSQQERVRVHCLSHMHANYVDHRASARLSDLHVQCSRGCSGSQMPVQGPAAPAFPAN